MEKMVVVEGEEVLAAEGQELEKLTEMDAENVPDTEMNPVVRRDA
jgi:hypothetical protein